LYIDDETNIDYSATFTLKPTFFMSKQFLPLAICFLLATACNNNSEKTETAEAAKTDSPAHEAHPAPPAGSEIPPVPEIPAEAKVYFKNLKDGSTVSSPIKIEMGVDKMALDTANGKIKPASGHHHILIGLDSVLAGEVIPKDSTHLHFGNAQSQAEVKLAPGKYKLTLQFADALHRSYGTKLTSSVNITVKK
jgi:hypothetical protein